MSIQNIQNDNNKSWLDGKFGSLNAKILTIPAGKLLKIDAGSELILEGNPGTVGDILVLNNAGNLVWSEDGIGDTFEDASFIESGPPFVTTSGTFVDVTGTTFTTSSLPGNSLYILFFSLELSNIDVAVAGAFAQVSMVTPTPTIYKDWRIMGNSATYDNCQGFAIINLTGVNTFKFQIRSGTPGQSTSARKVRYLLYKLAD